VRVGISERLARRQSNRGCIDGRHVVARVGLGELQNARVSAGGEQQRCQARGGLDRDGRIRARGEHALETLACARLVAQDCFATLESSRRSREERRFDASEEHVGFGGIAVQGGHGGGDLRADVVAGASGHAVSTANRRYGEHARNRVAEREPRAHGEPLTLSDPPKQFTA
jgi:hypothetical protein